MCQEEQRERRRQEAESHLQRSTATGSSTRPISEGFRVGGANQLKPASALPREYESDTLDNYELGAKTEWLDNRLRFNVAAYYMKWNDFAVQIEDPQPVFQLGFVNLPSAKIKGVEGDFAFTLSDEWQLDGSFSRNNTATEAATFVVNGDPTPEVPDGIYTFAVEKGARLPLTPDLAASLGLEFRTKRQARRNAEPFARFDYSYVGNSVNALEGIEAVVIVGPRSADQHAYHDRRSADRARRRQLERLDLRRQPTGTSARSCQHHG